MTAGVVGDRWKSWGSVGDEFPTWHAKRAEARWGRTAMAIGLNGVGDGCLVMDAGAGNMRGRLGIFLLWVEMRGGLWGNLTTR